MAQLVRDDGIPSAQRLQIYSNSIRLGFLAAMQATYPVIEQLGGADWFAQHARAYQLRYPSPSGDLQNVGARFTDYLQTELSGSDYEYFVDVARLEWAYQHALTAAESVALDSAALANIAADDYEHLVFAPRAALRLVASAYPIFAIWQAHQPNAPVIKLNLDAGPSHVLVIRRDDHVELRELPAASSALLKQCMQGTAFGAAVEIVAAQQPDFDLGASLRQLLSLSCFTTVHVRAADSHFSDSIHIAESNS
jgi:hypothetical protein